MCQGDLGAGAPAVGHNNISSRLKLLSHEALRCRLGVAEATTPAGVAASGRGASEVTTPGTGSRERPAPRQGCQALGMSFVARQSKNRSSNSTSAFQFFLRPFWLRLGRAKSSAISAFDFFTTSLFTMRAMRAALPAVPLLSSTPAHRSLTLAHRESAKVPRNLHSCADFHSCAACCALGTSVPAAQVPTSAGTGRSPGPATRTPGAPCHFLFARAPHRAVRALVAACRPRSHARQPICL